jgi:hypothetical protein
MKQSNTNNSHTMRYIQSQSAQDVINSRETSAGVVGPAADVSEAERIVSTKEPNTMTQTAQITQAPTVPVYVAKVGTRRFTAAVAYRPAPNGWLVSDVSPQRRSAIRSLEAKLREAGAAVPKFRVVDKGDLTAKAETPAAQPEATSAPAPKPATAQVLNPDAPDVDEEADTLRTMDTIADEAEQALEDAKQTMTLTPTVAPKMSAGYVTPLSDRQHWLDVFEQARTKLSGLTFPGEKRHEQIANYRESVNVLMESIGFVGPWRRAIGGDYWVRVAGAVDETVRQPRAGDGNRRLRYHRDINGNVIDRREEARANDKAIREELDRKALTRKERKELNRAAHANQRKAEKKAAYTGGNSDQRKAAFAHGRYLAGQASHAGHDSHTRTIWFKLGVVASLKAQGVPEPHRYEADLVAEGYADAIAEHTAALAANAA